MDLIFFNQIGVVWGWDTTTLEKWRVKREVAPHPNQFSYCILGWVTVVSFSFKIVCFRQKLLFQKRSQEKTNHNTCCDRREVSKNQLLIFSSTNFVLMLLHGTSRVIEMDTCSKQGSQKLSNVKCPGKISSRGEKAGKQARLF